MTEADDKIRTCLESRKSFLLDAGAGSGKTSSLVKALNYIRTYERDRLFGNGQRVACITFTNVAKDEIRERTEHDPLFEVSTIHDFLWRAVAPFQKELKKALVAYNDALEPRSRVKQDSMALQAAMQEVPKIVYSDRGANFLEGRIFHDHLLGVSSIMFREHPLLSQVVAAKYPFIFVDEYQDTDEKVIAILMDCLSRIARPPVIGFFGDKFQNIYPDGVGELHAGHQALLVPIKKQENYRCSKAVITLLNRIRSDIEQVPAGKNVQGSAVYINLFGLPAHADVDAAAIERAMQRFGTDMHHDLKVLFLTHRLIARKAGYENLWSAYSDRGTFARERFQSGEDPIAAFLIEKVEPLLEAWMAGNVGQAVSIIGKSGKLAAARDEKKRIRDAMDKLVGLVAKGATLESVLRHLRASELVPLLDDLNAVLNGAQAPVTEADSPEAEHQLFMARLMNIPYQEVQRYRAVLRDNLPYSTKHGVKGEEFENVLVILDDAGARWNQYSFDNLLAGKDRSESRLRRTRNLFYVCCSRAKRNLVVADLGAPAGKRSAVEVLFGKDSVAL